MKSKVKLIYTLKHRATKITAVCLAILAAASISFGARVRDNQVDSSTPAPKTTTKIQEKKTTTVLPKGSVGSATPLNSGYVKVQKKKNSDTIGWITVPGTSINEVVMYKPQYKNLYYGSRDFAEKPLKNGTAFADYRNSFGDGTRNSFTRNTVVYGHSWTDNPNDILFSQLKKYRNKDFAKKHPYIYLSTENDNIAFEVFAVMDTHYNFPYNLSEPTLNFSVDDVLQATRDLSIYDYNVDVSPQDRILTISTCTNSIPGNKNLPKINNYRFAVVAKMVSPHEIAKKQADFTPKEMVANADKYDKLKK